MFDAKISVLVVVHFQHFRPSLYGYIRRAGSVGTADITIQAWPEVLEVDDYKNGYLGVEHEDNDQARAYLLGKAIESDFSYETYRAGIIQPNFHHTEGAIRIVDYTAEDLKKFGREYEKSIARCEKAEAEFTNAEDEEWTSKWLKAGDHCTFCEAGAGCPARRKLAEDVARIEFDDTPGDLHLPAVAKRGEVLGSTEEQVAHILGWAPFLEQLILAAKLYAHRAMEAGYEIPGFKLVARRSNRKLVEEAPEVLAKQLVKAGFLKNSEVKGLFVTKLKSGPQIEKMIPKKLRKKFAAEFLVKPDNGTAVAPIDDARASVEPAIETDFEDVTDELDFG